MQLFLMSKFWCELESKTLFVTSLSSYNKQDQCMNCMQCLMIITAINSENYQIMLTKRTTECKVLFSLRCRQLGWPCRSLSLNLSAPLASLRLKVPYQQRGQEYHRFRQHLNLLPESLQRNQVSVLDGCPSASPTLHQ